MRIYRPTEKATSCQYILQSTHSLLAASLKLCESDRHQTDGVAWVCYIIQHAPMVGRNLFVFSVEALADVNSSACAWT